MVHYTCKRCGFSTDKRDTISSHFKRLTPCNPTHSDTPNYVQLKEVMFHEEKEHVCTCGKSYTTIARLRDHQKRACQPRPFVVPENPVEVACLLLHYKEKADAAEQEVRRLRAQQGSSAETVPDTSDTAQQDPLEAAVRNGVVHSIRNINTDYIDMEFTQQCYNLNMQEALSQMVKRMFFDPQHPENHLVTLESSKQDVARWIVNSAVTEARVKDVSAAMAEFARFHIYTTVLHPRLCALGRSSHERKIARMETARRNFQAINERIRNGTTSLEIVPVPLARDCETDYTPVMEDIKKWKEDLPAHMITSVHKEVMAGLKARRQNQA